MTKTNFYCFISKNNSLTHWYSSLISCNQLAVQNKIYATRFSTLQRRQINVSVSASCLKLKKENVTAKPTPVGLRISNHLLRLPTVTAQLTPAIRLFHSGFGSTTSSSKHNSFNVKSFIYNDKFYQIRSYSDQAEGISSHKVAYDVEKGQVKLTVNGTSLNIPALWLRDHCRSSLCYNHETFQKNADPDLLDRDLGIQTVKLVQSPRSCLEICWKDGHTSEFPVNWLVSNYYTKDEFAPRQRLLWDKHSIASQTLPVVSYDDHMSSEAGLAHTLSNICTFGFSIVEGAEVSLAGTQSVVERVTFVMETLFGGMWSFTSDASRSDTAYSTMALGSHTDQTYMDCPAGIQVFHCLEHTGKGGETLLVDGFNSMEMLRQSYPHDFDVLANSVVPHEYREEPSGNSPGYHLYSLGTVIKTHPVTGELIQIRFNPYDRAPLNTVATEDITSFYTAYDRLSRIIAEPDGQLWIKLKPGQIVFIDNWRVMHGRAAFDGRRMMAGCYLPRDEWVSRARILGVW